MSFLFNKNNIIIGKTQVWIQWFSIIDQKIIIQNIFIIIINLYNRLNLNI